MREKFLLEIMILQKENGSTNHNVNVTLLSDSRAIGRTLCGLFIACDTNFTHILVNELKTPVGFLSGALLRLNDVIAISYC